MFYEERHRQTRVWLKLVIANAAVFLLQQLFPLEQLFSLGREGLWGGQFWRFFTYMFLHGSLMHLLLNMLTLMFAGREVEALLGRTRMLFIYFGGGLLGGILQLLATGGLYPLVGASAAVFAVLIAFTTIMPESEIMLLLFFVVPVRLKAKYLALGLVVLSILFIATGTGGNIGHVAHLGGALFGWAYARKLGYGYPFRIQEFFQARRERKARENVLSPEEFISAEIDPILDKISREGIHSLTRAERRILELGREKIQRRTGGNAN